ncbi:MAG TPA: CRTAC1 family protein [Thermoanaerobaculia bacterium]|nr:CRTAC1 family protein [Thermoanaerobaculia bacterium]
MSRLLPLLLFALASFPMPAEGPPDERRQGLETIVGVIETLEGKSDAKCHATATRLENFMYGTPLTSAARARKVDLQKALIRDLWLQATRAARAKGAAAVDEETLSPLIARVFRPEPAPDGNTRIPLDDDSWTTLGATDIRQYASIAYALRAILAVQQESMLATNLDLLPMSGEAIDRLKQAVDVLTLGTLQIGDRMARQKEEHAISAETLARAWHRVVPATGEQAARAEPPAFGEPEAAAALLRRIIDQKLVSYDRYNQVQVPLLYSNIKSFYARHPWPEDRQEIEAIQREFSKAIGNFIAQTMLLAEKVKDAAGAPLIRESHVEQVYEALAPFEINQYEDITYFFHLPRDRQVRIEAYDADSFRDSGLHWQLIGNVLDSRGFPLRSDFDPFAAELLAEGTAQMSVLIYRVAGLIAKEEGAPALSSSHIPKAWKRIAGSLEQHLKTPPAERPAARLLSMPSRTVPAGEGTFFDDVTHSTAIDFEHRSSDWLNRFQRTFLYQLHRSEGTPEPGKEPGFNAAPSFSGSGIAAEDVDGDGWPDLLIVGGAGNRLYRNRGDGTFQDVTGRAGINWLGEDGKPGEPRQPIIADFDNDGIQDILITYVDAPHRLYRGQGDFRFEDVTARANLGGKGLVGGPATAFDFDRDGLLDLYIGYYGNYLAGEGPHLTRSNANATPNKLFRNKGGMLFHDVSASSGTENRGWTQAVSHVDLDGDGWQDLIVANDFGVNAYYRNLGNGSFADISRELGTDVPNNAMNVGTADLNGDGFPDIYISNILTMVKDEKYVLPTEETRMKLNPQKLGTMRIIDANHLFTSVARGQTLLRYEMSEAIDRGDTSTGWAWDADFFDFDNDGDDDLYCVNGLNEYNIYQGTHTFETRQGAQRTIIYSVNEREANVFFLNEDGKLRNRSSQSGADFLGNSRSAVNLDYDGDGDLDIVVANYHSAAVVLRNNSEKLGNHWLKIRLIGDPAKGSNRDAIGARIVATTSGGGRVFRTVQGSTGYLSMHPREQHLGLGAETAADVTIHWPNGEIQTLRGLEAGRLHVIEQARASAGAGSMESGSSAAVIDARPVP